MVECHLAKVDVEGSNPFSRSTEARSCRAFSFCRGVVRVILLEPTPHSDQDLLHEVLGIGVVARQAIRHRVEEPPVIAGDLLPGGNLLGNVSGGWRVPADQLALGSSALGSSVLGSSFVPSSWPLRNSRWASPNERASLGSLAPPKNRRLLSLQTAGRF